MVRHNWRERPEVRYLKKNIDKSKYEIKTLVGVGGFGVVMKVWDRINQKDLAFKIMKLDNLAEITEGGDQDLLKRFFREVKYTAKLDHQNIVKIHKFENCDIDQIMRGEYPYIIMDYIEGQSLETEIRKKSPFSITKIISLSKDILSALSYMHKKGIVHRDLKPGNIILDTNNKKAVIIDFGLAKDLQAQSKLTKSNTLMGSYPYMSPEQWLNKNIGFPTDIYSFGVMLFEMVTGQLPYNGNTFEELGPMHVASPVPDVEEKGSRFSDSINQILNKIIKKTMAKEVNNRYANIEELSKDLEELGKPNKVDVNESVIRQVDNGKQKTVAQKKELKPIAENRQTDVKLKIEKRTLSKAISFVIFLVVITAVILTLFFGRRGDRKVASSPKPTVIGKTLTVVGDEKQSTGDTRRRGKYQLPTQTEKEATEKLFKSTYINKKCFPEAELFNGTVMVYIPPGEFCIGATQHPVCLEGFWISKYEITFDQYDRFCQDTGQRKPKDENWGRGKRPVINIDWHDAKKYCNWLSEKTDLRFDLPTEVEWEKAARGGRKTAYFWGGNPIRACRYANIADETLKRVKSISCIGCSDGYTFTAPVVRKRIRSNPYGLFDTLGNVWEWIDNDNGDNNEFSIIRGGCWGSNPSNFSLTSSKSNTVSYKSFSIGFRPCMRSSYFNTIFSLYGWIIKK